MKVEFRIVVSKENLRGAKASFHFNNYAEVIEAEVTAVTGVDYQAENKDQELFKKELADGLIVLNVVADFEHYKVYRGSPPKALKFVTNHNLTFNVNSKNRSPESVKNVVPKLQERYPSLTVDGSKVSLQDYPLTFKLVAGVRKKIKETIEAVTIGFGNPFPRCDVSRIKVLDVDRPVFDHEFKGHYFKEYKSMLQEVLKKKGPDAFTSLTRISGSAKELDCFFSLFSNREFEVIGVKGKGYLSAVEGLSTDRLLLGRMKSPGERALFPFARRVSHNSFLSTVKLLSTEGTSFAVTERGGFGSPINLDLSSYTLTSRLSVRCAYNYYIKDTVYEFSEDSDEEGDLISEAVPFNVVLDFDRMEGHKSAKF